MNSGSYGKRGGYVSVEYLVTSSVVLMVLFFPLPIINSSVIDVVMEALKAFQTSTTHLLSIP